MISLLDKTGNKIENKYKYKIHKYDNAKTGAILNDLI